jgi:hydroxypyruvate reductase
MLRSTAQRRDDALAIWSAAVRAVDSCRLVRKYVRVEGRQLLIGDESIRLDSIRRIIVVGAGKAGAGMAEGIELALGEPLMAAKDLAGWINVPEDCVRPLSRIRLHGARPAGINEPTEAGVIGTQRILDLVTQASADDLCICLLSGGGSALLPAPVQGIRLADKQAVTKHLSGAGANILELNTVRKQLSRIKGGGLARECRAGRLRTLIISDVLGDPLDVIASGPTVPNQTTAQDALRVLEQFSAREAGIASQVFDRLEQADRTASSRAEPGIDVKNLIIGNNAAAVDAAGIEAERRGYNRTMTSSSKPEGTAEEVGSALARTARRMQSEPGPDCLITGGEPVVQLVPSPRRGRGGRNQQLVLASLLELIDPLRSGEARHNATAQMLSGITILSGGTDGEDGPTDAAGAMIDDDFCRSMAQLGLDPFEHLARNNAYPFFEAIGSLLKTGPTHTNVCDVRVVVVDRMDRQTGAS